ncbi:deoxyribonuclease V [Candidatus Bathyarchaeota archaeon]|nr:deoxyribonuclease V [Candidatus Bathyarchaeota archaeon]
MVFTSGLTSEKAKNLQKSLSKKVICRDQLPRQIKLVGGVDVAYTDELAVGSVAILEYETLKVVETKTSCQPIEAPYVPTFLSFREIPPVVSAVRSLSVKPDVFLVDGHGVAHPRGLGFASHLGLILDAATIGVAKNLLFGEIRETEVEDWKPIVYSDATIGAALYMKTGVKPIFISIGHKISLETAIKIVKHCLVGHRIPEPIREAHKSAIETKQTRLHY